MATVVPPAWKLARLKAATPEVAQSVQSCVNDSENWVNTPSVNTKDRHKPGYMAEYMRQRRAARKAK